MLTKKGSVRGCKKPNGRTLASEANSALATGITGTRLPETKYRTVTIKNKQGAKRC
ncbi:YtfJ family protein [Xenorhabdus bovienii]|uniref:YtfJ family protein n=1 Tax=Xenorhabdus bovienii TaxID=40576 RepID=UPI0012D317C9